MAGSGGGLGKPLRVEKPKKFDLYKNKAGYTAGQSRMVQQERKCKNHSQFRNITNVRTDRRTDHHGKV